MIGVLITLYVYIYFEKQLETLCDEVYDYFF